jgi:hypothetical protein
MPNFAFNGHAFHDAPKNGGTTVRMWLKHVEGGLPAGPVQEGYCTLAGIGPPRLWTDTVMGPQPFFSPAAPGLKPWCILRDPVERFISAYTDKILREALAPWTVDQCLDMLLDGRMERIARTGQTAQTAQTARTGAPRPHRQAACHLLGQSLWFGTEPGYFDRIFAFAEMGRVREFCEDQVFGMRLPPFHGRNLALSGTPKVRLSQAQTARLEQSLTGADLWCRAGVPS